jgi:hypothetical protein
MASWGISQSRKIAGGKYHWKLQSWCNQLFLKYDSCVVCGRKTDLQPHHVVKVRPFDASYTSIDNGVIMCKHCHYEYHSKYSEINAGTLLEFAKSKLKK